MSRQETPKLRTKKHDYQDHWKLIAVNPLCKDTGWCSAAWLVMTLSACSTPQTLDPEMEIKLELEARSISQQFVSTLLPTLQQALQNGGPVTAIEVCSVQAPFIARTLATESGWEVSRKSLKARNSSSAIPDDWETETLESFDRRQRAGEAGTDINASAIVENDYRYMQAQPTMPLCLTCHGSNISEEVSKALGRFYPDDMATGYSTGEIRGAISLSKKLD